MKSDKLLENMRKALQGKLVEGNSKQEKEDFIKQCEESGKFDGDQLWQIKNGFTKGLTLEQVKLYADLKFDDDQMQEIKEGFYNGLPMEQVKLYADPKFNDNQMFQIRTGFTYGLTLEQVKLYADLKFEDDQMEQIRLGFEDGLTMEQVKSYADPEFDWRQMCKIRRGFEDELKSKQGKLIKDKQDNLGKLSLKNFLNYLVDNNYLKLGDKNIKSIIEDKLKQNGYSEEEVIPLYDRSVFDDSFNHNVDFTDHYYEPKQPYYRIAANKAEWRQDFIKYLNKVKERCKDKDLYGYFINSYYGPEIRLYVFSDNILDKLNTPKSPEEIEKQREEIEKQRMEKRHNTQLKVNEIYESILQEFEDDMTDLYIAYERCNGTLESFIRQLNTWGQDWLSTIKDNYDCSTAMSKSVTKKLFDYIKTNKDKED